VHSLSSHHSAFDCRSRVSDRRHELRPSEPLFSKISPKEGVGKYRRTLENMPGRMSINWLLNEDEESGPCGDQVSPPSQTQEDRWNEDQELRSDYTYAPTHASTNPLLYRVNQQQYHSAHSNLTVRQHRASSVSSRTSSISRSAQPRPPRPKYSAEEDHFIWYQRIDLEKDWKEVSHAFNEHFRDRHRDGESGLQCRFYRILDAAGIPNIRTLKNSNDKERIAQFGLVQQTRYRYNWMLPRHRAA
jgi:hypothetical protein